MTSRERLATTLDHRQPDRVCVDFGATFVTGIHVSVVDRLRRALLPDRPSLTRVHEPYQMLGEIDDDLRLAIGADVIGTPARRSLFGTDQRGWKPFTLFDGTEVLVPHNFNTTIDPDTGDLLVYPEGDLSVPPSGRMPRDGHFFDSIIRQEPIDDDRLDPADNLEEFQPFSEEDREYYRQRRHWFDSRPDAGTILIVPGTAFGDIALVPAPFLKRPRGIRDVAEWYISTASRKEYVRAIFERQCEIALGNLEFLLDTLGDAVQVALITGTDFGTQRGTFIAPAAYRDLFKPYHVAVNRLIHSRSRWKTFIHSCGAVRDLIPDFIDAGFDILNPVQCSAVNMDPRELKREFGRDIVFWGGGVDTQRTLPFGAPDEVYRQVRERIDIFNEGGGFVFNTIHNIQGNTPTENVLAMLRAIRDSAAA